MGGAQRNTAAPPPWEDPPGWGAEPSLQVPPWPDGTPTPRATPNAAPGRLQEFLQDALSRARAPADGAVRMQLPASMAELPRMTIRPLDLFVAEDIWPVQGNKTSM